MRALVGQDLMIPTLLADFRRFMQNITDSPMYCLLPKPVGIRAYKHWCGNLNWPGVQPNLGYTLVDTNYELSSCNQFCEQQGNTPLVGTWILERGIRRLNSAAQI